MTRGVRLYLVGSLVLVSLAGCGRGFFQSAEREPWRAEAEIACLKSGAVKENADLVRIDPISGPGVCGAEFPLKVAALGESNSSFGFADDDLRPPASIGNQPRWPVSQPPPPPPPRPIPTIRMRQPGYGADRLERADLAERAGRCACSEDDIDLPAEGVADTRRSDAPQAYPQRAIRRRASYSAAALLAPVRCRGTPAAARAGAGQSRSARSVRSR